MNADTPAALGQTRRLFGAALAHELGVPSSEERKYSNAFLPRASGVPEGVGVLVSEEEGDGRTVEDAEVDGTGSKNVRNNTVTWAVTCTCVNGRG